MLVKGHVPLNGFSQKANEIAYKKQKIDFGLITGETVIEKETFQPTGGTGTITFLPNRVKSFLESIGDSEHTTNAKLKVITKLIGLFPQLNLFSSSIHIFEQYIYGKEILNVLHTGYVETTIIPMWEGAIAQSLNDTLVFFELQDSLGNTFGASNKVSKTIAYSHGAAEAVTFLMDDTTESGKYGFDTDEDISLVFKENIGGVDKAYSCSYNNSPFQAIIDSLYVISTITYSDAKPYNPLTT